MKSCEESHNLWSSNCSQAISLAANLKLLAGQFNRRLILDNARHTMSNSVMLIAADYSDIGQLNRIGNH